MTEDDALRAIYLRDDPVPPHIVPGATRASLCVDIRDEDLVARTEQWILAYVDQLTWVHNTGCGCCVIGWDIEGPQAVVKTAPVEAASEWLPPTSVADLPPVSSSRKPGWLTRWLRRR
ncbi:hypothetical protein IMZ29_14805 [Achromobacter sp. GG226]|uniref:hypothetical protein n=1 Tax=Verticiella alkaliphila TaxID=2779529 RepID=UPI001C0E8186|nr:hypothetical protein [Verticiella sp. GG226]MBU4611757.1 hypothetical protein [Verticiella sp. GG226]